MEKNQLSHWGGVACPYFFMFSFAPRSNFWNFWSLYSWAKWMTVLVEVPPGSWPRMVGSKVWKMSISKYTVFTGIWESEETGFWGSIKVFRNLIIFVCFQKEAKKIQLTSFYILEMNKWIQTWVVVNPSHHVHLLCIKASKEEDEVLADPELQHCLITGQILEELGHSVGRAEFTDSKPLQNSLKEKKKVD